MRVKVSKIRVIAEKPEPYTVKVRGVTVDQNQIGNGEISVGHNLYRIIEREEDTLILEHIGFTKVKEVLDVNPT